MVTKISDDVSRETLSDIFAGKL